MRRSRAPRKTLALAVFCFSLFAIPACNTILGLSDFDKTECAGRRCADANEPLEASVDADATDGRVVRGTDPVSWATWPMPNDEPDAANLPNPHVYEVVDDDRIEDKVTRLVWRRATLASQLGYEQANAACVALDRATGPWRLPKRIELVTLLDFARTSFFIDARFTGVKNVRVWTSSAKRPFTGVPTAYWTVNFESGVVDVLDATNGAVASVLCVRGK
jgi:hypothetical protein